MKGNTVILLFISFVIFISISLSQCKDNKMSRFLRKKRDKNVGLKFSYIALNKL